MNAGSRSLRRLASRRTSVHAPGGWIVTPKRFLDREQARALRDYLRREHEQADLRDDKKAKRDAAIIEVLLDTGLRVSELCALKVGDVFVADGRGDVLVRRGKGGRSRLVAISTQLGEFVVKFISWKARAGQSTDGTAPLFTSQRWGHLTPSAVHRVWKAALVSAGLPSHYGVHATRHTFAVALYRATRDLRLVQRQRGHASVVTTTVYADLCDEDLRQGVEQLWK